MVFDIAWTSQYESSPADTDLASLGAQQIRQLKQAIAQRISFDHELGAGTSDIAGHKQVSFLLDFGQVGTDLPAERSGEVGRIYPKGTRLYYKRRGQTEQAIYLGDLPTGLTQIEYANEAAAMAASQAGDNTIRWWPE